MFVIEEYSFVGDFSLNKDSQIYGFSNFWKKIYSGVHLGNLSSSTVQTESTLSFNQAPWKYCDRMVYFYSIILFT